MNFLGTIDYATLIVYVIVIMALGVFLSRKAAGSLEDYYLGGRSLPWYLLGASGMAAWFDVTGTMVTVAFLYLIGPRGLFIEFRGGAVLILAFALTYAGKWHRRSQCITAAEWNIFRFGKGPDAEIARFAQALIQLIWTVGMLGYLVRGVGLFLAMFFPFSPTQCAVALLIIATLYTMLSGFYGVVLTDLIQTIIIVFMAFIVSIMAFRMVPGVEQLTTIAGEVTGNMRWTTSYLTKNATMPIGYEMYESLMMFAMFYLLRNILGGMGTGAEPKYFAARSDRDCGLLSFLVAWLIMVRWPMMMGFAVLGVYMIHQNYSDPTILPQVVDLIKNFHPDVTAAGWHDLTAQIALAPAQFSQEMINGLQALLGADWSPKLSMVGFNGTINPERIMPAVITEYIPMGLRGLMMVALIAASMSTFDSTVNMSSGFFVRDIYQRWIRPKAGNRELIIASYAAVVGLVVAGFTMGVAAKNINHIWGWIIMSLTAGKLAPDLLRLYWWRINGWGVAAGLFLGGFGAVLQRHFSPDMVEWKQFLLMTFLSFLGAIGGSLLTSATSKEVVRNFYKTTKPFGWWGPYKQELDPEERAIMEKEHRNDIIATPFALLFQVTLFLLPMQLVIHAYKSFFATLPLFLFASAGMYWFWYRNLSARDEEGCDNAVRATVKE